MKFVDLTTSGIQVNHSISYTIQAALIWMLIVNFWEVIGPFASLIHARRSKRLCRFEHLFSRKSRNDHEYPTEDVLVKLFQASKRTCSSVVDLKTCIHDFSEIIAWKFLELFGCDQHFKLNTSNRWLMLVGLDEHVDINTCFSGSFCVTRMSWSCCMFKNIKKSLDQGSYPKAYPPGSSLMTLKWFRDEKSK